MLAKKETIRKTKVDPTQSRFNAAAIKSESTTCNKMLTRLSSGSATLQVGIGLMFLEPINLCVGAVNLAQAALSKTHEKRRNNKTFNEKDIFIITPDGHTGDITRYHCEIFKAAQDEVFRLQALFDSEINLEKRRKLDSTILGIISEADSILSDANIRHKVGSAKCKLGVIRHTKGTPPRNAPRLSV